MKKLKGSLMVQGTTSDAGKSILVAGLCRLLKIKGVSVSPFKPLNMALNSALTSSGGEIGRAQALQAIACGLEPHIDFNPVLLKPSNDKQSQVIIHGKAVSQLEAESFGNIKTLAFEKVLESYRRLQQQYDVIVIEGAGSPAEVNLRANDIANMGFAEAVNCPVILISDIDRGGVFAHLTGTVNLLSETEKKLIKGFVVNKFRGDLTLLQDGLDWLEGYSNKKVIGVLPYLQNLKLDAEDAIKIDPQEQTGEINIKVIVLPRISNHTDFEPLSANANVSLSYIREASELNGAELVIIPGSKSVRDDLKYLKENGWDQAINKHLRYGGKLLGICGGYQMLGNKISDPIGVEGDAGESNGLGLMSLETELTDQKILKQVSGDFELEQQKGNISGYEIHCGISFGEALKHPFCNITDQNGRSYADGSVTKDGQIIGTYLHGLFESSDVIQSVLKWVSGKILPANDWNIVREQQLERLTDMLEENLDMDSIIEMIA
jgi:adenosylcobyric acid synthase